MRPRGALITFTILSICIIIGCADNPTRHTTNVPPENPQPKADNPTRHITKVEIDVQDPTGARTKEAIPFVTKIK